MPTLHLDGREIPLRLPSPLDRLGLFRAYRKHEDADATLARLDFAAIGLAWDTSQAPAPWKHGLADMGGDLVRFGEQVQAALGDEALIALDAQGDAILAWIFSTLKPPTKAEVEEARGNSDAAPEAAP